MDYYYQVQNYFKNPSKDNVPKNLQYGTVNSFNAINIPFGDNLLPSNAINRQGAPNYESPTVRYIGGQVIQPGHVIGPQNNQTVKHMNDNFLNVERYPEGTPLSVDPIQNFSNTSLQNKRLDGTYYQTHNQVYTNKPAALNDNNSNNSDVNYQPKIYKNYYIGAASESLHQKPDLLMRVFFSDENINHLRNTVVAKVREITADSGVAGDKNGVTIQPPNIDDFFYYMVNIFQNYKIHNGSICFVNLKNDSTLKADIAQLNTNVLQDYVPKMVSQINMYIYYYKDASQLPEQLSLPTYTSMKGSRVLEYNVGFQPGNSVGVASYNEVGNIM